MFESLQVISAYSRAQAIEDGVLIDATELAREAGSRWPVAVTQTLWSEYVVPDPTAVGQSEQGRLWDIFNTWAFMIRLGRARGTTIVFNVIMTMGFNEPRNIEIKAVCGPGDNNEPVITFMLPYED